MEGDGEKHGTREPSEAVERNHMGSTGASPLKLSILGSGDAQGIFTISREKMLRYISYTATWSTGQQWSGSHGSGDRSTASESGNRAWILRLVTVTWARERLIST